MSGPFAHLATGEETLADVARDARAAGFPTTAYSLTIGRPVNVLRDAIYFARRWGPRAPEDARLFAAVVLALAWRAYRASPRNGR
jgi:hypothetical protein